MKQDKKRNSPASKKRQQLVGETSDSELVRDLTPEEIAALRQDKKESSVRGKELWAEILSNRASTDGSPEESIAADESRPFGEFTEYYRDLARAEKGEFSECDLCGKTIKIGNAFVGVNREVAQVDQDQDLIDSTITVIDSDELLTLCAKCGNRVSTAKLKEHLQLFLQSLRAPS